MAQGDSTDLIMKIERSKGVLIPAESTTQMRSLEGSSNPLLSGFKKGFMFEIDRFSFRAGTSGDEAAGHHPAKPKSKSVKGPKAPPTLADVATKGDYQAWRAGKSLQYPVDLQPSSFTRPIDSASTTLMQDCIDCFSYERASLIKRKAAGGAAAGEVFLRIDFIGVLVINIDWSDDDEVSETCHFISRSITISYRPQLPDGTLGAVVPGFWSMVPGETIAPLC